jgi:hypothetical protein
MSVLDSVAHVDPLSVLSGFRQDFYACLDTRGDALFELVRYPGSRCAELAPRGVSVPGTCVRAGEREVARAARGAVTAAAVQRSPSAGRQISQQSPCLRRSVAMGPDGFALAGTVTGGQVVLDLFKPLQ